MYPQKRLYPLQSLLYLDTDGKAVQGSDGLFVSLNIVIEKLCTTQASLKEDFGQAVCLYYLARVSKLVCCLDLDIADHHHHSFFFSGRGWVVLTNCCAMAARLQKANVTWAEVSSCAASFCSRSGQEYFSVMASSSSERRPDRRGKSRGSTSVPESGRRSTPSSKDGDKSHSCGIEACRSCRLAAAASCHDAAAVSIILKTCGGKTLDVCSDCRSQQSTGHIYMLNLFGVVCVWCRSGALSSIL